MELSSVEKQALLKNANCRDEQLNKYKLCLYDGDIKKVEEFYDRDEFCHEYMIFNECASKDDFEACPAMHKESLDKLLDSGKYQRCIDICNYFDMLYARGLLDSINLCQDSTTVQAKIYEKWGDAYYYLYLNDNNNNENDRKTWLKLSNIFYDKSSDLQPRNEKRLLRQAEMLCYNSKDYVKSEKIYQNLFAFCNKDYYYYSFGKSLKYQKKYKQSIDIFKKALNIKDKRNPRYLFELGYSQYQTGIQIEKQRKNESKYDKNGKTKRTKQELNEHFLYFDDSLNTFEKLLKNKRIKSILKAEMIQTAKELVVKIKEKLENVDLDIEDIRRYIMIRDRNENDIAAVNNNGSNGSNDDGGNHQVIPGASSINSERKDNGSDIVTNTTETTMSYGYGSHGNVNVWQQQDLQQQQQQQQPGSIDSIGQRRKHRRRDNRHSGVMGASESGASSNSSKSSNSSHYGHGSLKSSNQRTISFAENENQTEMTNEIETQAQTLDFTQILQNDSENENEIEKEKGRRKSARAKSKSKSKSIAASKHSATKQRKHKNENKKKNKKNSDSSSRSSSSSDESEKLNDKSGNSSVSNSTSNSTSNSGRTSSNASARRRRSSSSNNNSSGEDRKSKKARKHKSKKREKEKEKGKRKEDSSKDRKKHKRKVKRNDKKEKEKEKKKEKRRRRRQRESSSESDSESKDKNEKSDSSGNSTSEKSRRRRKSISRSSDSENENVHRRDSGDCDSSDEENTRQRRKRRKERERREKGKKMEKEKGKEKEEKRRSKYGKQRQRRHSKYRNETENDSSRDSSGDSGSSNTSSESENSEAIDRKRRVKRQEKEEKYKSSRSISRRQKRSDSSKRNVEARKERERSERGERSERRERRNKRGRSERSERREREKEREEERNDDASRNQIERKKRQRELKGSKNEEEAITPCHSDASSLSSDHYQANMTQSRKEDDLFDNKSIVSGKSGKSGKSIRSMRSSIMKSNELERGGYQHEMNNEDRHESNDKRNSASLSQQDVRSRLANRQSVGVSGYGDGSYNNKNNNNDNNNNNDGNGYDEIEAVLTPIEQRKVDEFHKAFWDCIVFKRHLKDKYYKKLKEHGLNVVNQIHTFDYDFMIDRNGIGMKILYARNLMHNVRLFNEDFVRFKQFFQFGDTPRRQAIFECYYDILANVHGIVTYQQLCGYLNNGGNLEDLLNSDYANEQLRNEGKQGMFLSNTKNLLQDCEVIRRDLDTQRRLDVTGVTPNIANSNNNNFDNNNNNNNNNNNDKSNHGNNNNYIISVERKVENGLRILAEWECRMGDSDALLAITLCHGDIVSYSGGAIVSDAINGKICGKAPSDTMDAIISKAGGNGLQALKEALPRCDDGNRCQRNDAVITEIRQIKMDENNNDSNNNIKNDKNNGNDNKRKGMTNRGYSSSSSEDEHIYGERSPSKGAKRKKENNETSDIEGESDSNERRNGKRRKRGRSYGRTRRRRSTSSGSGRSCSRSNTPNWRDSESENDNSNNSKRKRGRKYSNKNNNKCSLSCDFVIHAVAPNFKDEKSRFESLSKCYKNSLNLCKKYKIKCVAFCLLSVGYKQGNETLYDLMQHAFMAMKKFLSRLDKEDIDGWKLERICFVAHSKHEIDKIINAAKNAFSNDKMIVYFDDNETFDTYYPSVYKERGRERH